MGTNTEYKRFVLMDEVAPEVPIEIMPPAVAKVEVAAKPCLDEETMKKMKVSELRAALQARGLPKNGLKSILLDRLKAAIAEGVPLVTNRPAVEVENSAGTDFHPSAYWKEIDPNGEEIDEFIMDVDGHQFRAPTTSAGDHDGQYADASKRETMTNNLIGVLSLHLLDYNQRKIKRETTSVTETEITCTHNKQQI